MTSPASPCKFSLAGDAPDLPLRFDEESLSWIGATDPDDGAPRLCLHMEVKSELTRAFRDAIACGDPSGVDAGIALYPLPGGLLAAIAGRCLDQAPERVAAFLAEPTQGDPRWRRALASQIDGELRLPALSARLCRVHRADAPLGVDSVLVVGDAIAILERPTAGLPRLTLLREEQLGWTREFAVTEASLDLLPELMDEASCVTIGAYEQKARIAQLWRLSLDGVLMASVRFHCPTPPQAVLYRGGRALVRAACDTILIELSEWTAADDGDPLSPAGHAPKVPLLTSMERGGKWLQVWRLAVEIGGRVPLAIDDELRFVDVCAAHPDIVFPWEHAPVALHADRQALWIATEGHGVLRFRPDGPVEQVAAMRTETLTTGHGLLVVAGRVRGEAVLQGFRLEDDLPANQPVFSSPLPGDFSIGLTAIPQGFVLLAGSQLVYVSRAGQLSMLGEVAQGAYQVRTLALIDGVTAVWIGDSLWVLSSSGQLLRRHRGKGLALVGCTRDCFIVGLDARGWGNGWATLLAIGNDGAVRSVLEQPEPRWVPQKACACAWTTRDHAGIYRDGLLLVKDRELLWWRPNERDPAPLSLPRLEARKPALRNVQLDGGHTYSPRDDFPMAGLEVRAADLLAQRCRFAGSTGVFPAPDVIAEEGAVLVLERCQLRSLQVRGRSTVFLLDCPKRIAVDAEDGCHVVQVR